MAPALSPPKAVLLAAHLAATGDVAGLAALAAGHGEVLRKPLLLRLLLTYLPTHLPTASYLPLLQSLDTGDYAGFAPLAEPDPAPVAALSDAQAAKKLKKLQLQHLGLPREDQARSAAVTGTGEPTQDEDEDAPANDDLVAFLIQRACAVDSGSGALPDLPGLVAPFLDRSRRLRTWAVSTLLPLLRRNCEYYPDSPVPQTLADFAHLPDRLAVDQLLSQTGLHEEARGGSGGESGWTVVRDLRGLVGPWLYSERRWPSRQQSQASNSDGSSIDPASPSATQALCPGWEEVLQWLTTQAAHPSTWPVAIRALEQWDGPADVDLGGLGTLWLSDSEQAYLEQRYARAALACVYLVPDASQDALEAAHRVVAKIAGLLEHDGIEPLKQAATQLRPVSVLSGLSGLSQRGGTGSTSSTGLLQLSPQDAAYFLRHDLLDEANPLTTPAPAAIDLLHALLISASVLGHRGSPHTVRQVADLALLQSEREQKALANKLLHWITDNGPQSEYQFWATTRSMLRWLRDWGAEEAAKETAATQPAGGVLGRVSKAFLETEFLKALLAKSCFSFARTFFETGSEHSLSAQQIQDTVFAAAMTAYDRASNPNRTRGGLKKCDEIIHCFPKTVPPNLPVVRQTEALLAATHSLSSYRLVLKQGEPFTPVVLRVHADPLSILGKVLEQNPRSYTKIQDLLRVATHLVEAGLVKKGRNKEAAAAGDDGLEQQRVLAERRVTAMCIEAALNEDDFETAYSYVVGRLADTEAAAAASAAAAAGASASSRAPLLLPPPDPWSWRAALAAGKYRRTERTVRPTHLGIAASANLDIRHLEQRVACLATALRIAPADTLHEILVAYRRCEEELEAAVRAEEEQETAWDDEADWTSWQQQQQQQQQHTQTRKKHPPPQNMPGGFGPEPAGDARSSSSGGGVPLASRMAAAAAHRDAFAPTPPPAAGPAAAAADDTPLSLFDLSRATARVAQRNLTALANLRQTRQLVGLGGGGGGGDAGAAADADADADSSASSGMHVRKRDQLREAAMGTLTSGVGWLIGAQPVNRSSSGSSHRAGE